MFSKESSDGAPCFFTRMVYEGDLKRLYEECRVTQHHAETENDSYVIIKEEEYGYLQPFNQIGSELSLTVSRKNCTAEKSVSGKTLNWLIERCAVYLKEFSRPMFSAEQLAEQVVDICQLAGSADAAQLSLFELMGEQGIDLIGLILLHFEDVHQMKKELASRGSHGPSGGDMSPELPKGSLQSTDWLQSLGFHSEYLEQERMLGLQKNYTFESWTENLAPIGSTGQGARYGGLPANAQRSTGLGFEELFLPANTAGKHVAGEGELVAVSALERWSWPAFQGTQRLNAIQSRVFPAAYSSSENLLICAPTGAGKTNIAMLALLQLFRPLFTEGRGEN
ncbi:DEAD/DEAH box helicase, partial [archaeon]